MGAYEEAIERQERQTAMEEEYPRLWKEVERLRADRAALLDLWIVESQGGNGWQIRFEPIPSLTYLTREAADEAVLEWARSRVR